jgi:diaminopimelate decarboxylase
MFLTHAEATIVRERFDTPCYVYDRALLNSAARRALDFPYAAGLTVRYALKAISSGEVLAVFRDL